jgi:hypothetical protein
MTPKMIEATMMNLVTVKVRHISLLLTQETVQRETSPSRFLTCFSQNCIFSPFIFFNSTGWNLYSRFWSIWVTEYQQMMMMGDVGKDFVLDLSHIKKPFFLVQYFKKYITSSRSLRTVQSMPLGKQAISTKRAGEPTGCAMRCKQASDEVREGDGERRQGFLPLMIGSEGR